MKATTHILLLLVALVWVAVSCSLGGRLSGQAEETPLEPPAPTSPTAPSIPTADTPSVTQTGPLPATEAPTLVPDPQATPTAGDSQLPSSTPEPALPASPTPSLETSVAPQFPAPCAEDTCTSSGTFLLARPIAPPGRTVIDVSDRFGSYQKRTQSANHGVSFLNSTGTPVLAAADGVVVIAGNDSQINYGLHPGAYGSLVVIMHELPGISQPVYTLYAHLSEILVEVDELVQAGQTIGLVGMSGSVRGSTLHFEVRLGENTYASARNPELWLAPLSEEGGQSYGALAGRILDAEGAGVSVSNILIERLGNPGEPAVDQIYLKTYADRRLTGLSPWEESFAAGDLPAGSYQISFWKNGLQQRVVEIMPGQLTFVTFRI